MKKIFIASLLMVPAFSLMKVNAIDGVQTQNQKNIYVSPTGTLNGDGSMEHPYEIQYACRIAEPGTTINVMDGNYMLKSKLELYVKSGTAKQRNKLVAVNRGRAILDFTEMFNSEIDAGGYKKKYNTETEITEGDAAARGIQLNADYWDIKDLIIDSAGDNGIYIAGSYNTIDRCITTRCRDTGIQLGRIGSDNISITSWPSYNIIKNCTSYNNDDYTGEDADGFACKLTTGIGNVFDGCISYNNSDDGWDLYTKNSDQYDDMMIGSVTLRNCITFSHGRTTEGLSKSAGDGNGFKLGGERINGNHIVENCLAFNNTCHGFTDNSNPGSITVKNCTSFNNGISPEETKSNFDFARFNFAQDNNASNLTSNNYFVNNLSFSNIIQNKDKDGNMVDVMAIPDKYIGTAQNTLFSRYGYLFRFTDAEKCDHSSAEFRGESIRETFTAEDIFVTTTLPWTQDQLKANPGIVDELWRNNDGSVNVGDFLKVKPEFEAKVGMTNFGAKLY